MEKLSPAAQAAIKIAGQLSVSTNPSLWQLVLKMGRLVIRLLSEAQIDKLECLRGRALSIDDNQDDAVFRFLNDEVLPNLRQAKPTFFESKNEDSKPNFQVYAAACAAMSELMIDGPENSMASAPAVDEEDLRILGAMKTCPTQIWYQEQIESVARIQRKPVSRKTISKRCPGLIQAGLLGKARGRKGLQILDAGLQLLKLRHESLSHVGEAGIVQKKPRTPARSS